MRPRVGGESAELRNKSAQRFGINWAALYNTARPVKYAAPSIYDR